MRKIWSIKDLFLFAGIFVISLSSLCLEVVVHRMFSLMYWYHFAFFIISVAMFGMGFGSLLVYFTKNKYKDESYVLVIIGLLSVVMGLILPYVLLYVNKIPLNMDLFGKTTEQNIYFFEVFIALAIPYVILGYIISLVFTFYKDKINRIYFFDLIGGGIGTFIAMLIFPGNGPFITAYFISFMLFLSGALFLSKINWVSAIVVLTLTIVFNINYTKDNVKNIDVRVSKGSKRYNVNEKGKATGVESEYGKKVFEYWDNFAYVAVHEFTKTGYYVFADYSCLTLLPRVEVINGKPMVKPDYNNEYPYVINKKPHTVGIIGVGGGKNVVGALARGAGEIYGAEFNRTIYDIFTKHYASFVGNVASLSNVHIYPDEGRFFIRHYPTRYDILIFDNAIAQTAVNSGAFTIAESYLYTVEAMMDYLRHMNTNGIVYFSGPVVDADRLVVIAREAFSRLNLSDFDKSIMVIRTKNEKYPKYKIMVRNGVFNKEEVKREVSLVRTIGAEILYAPYYKNNDPYFEKIATYSNLNELYETSPLILKPSIDDWPFFSQRLKPGSNPDSKDVFEVRKFYPEPFLFLKNAVINVSIFSLLFLIFPLILFNLSGFKGIKNKIGSIVYFSSLGLGFMMLEVVFIQKYQLVLGHPLYSFVIVLSALLVSSGIGSLFSERFKRPENAIKIGVLGIVLSSILSYLFFMSGNTIVALSLALRVLLVILFVSISGFFMGFMMPSGLRIVSVSEDAIPWLWSINSVFSVVAGFITTYVSMLYGFSFILLLAVLIYVLGAGTLLLKPSH